MKLFVALVVTVALSASAEELSVIRKKPLWRDQQGTLRVEDSRLCFAPKGEDDSPRCWKYEDVQHLDRVSRTELALLSYEDAAWKLGRDRLYRFEVVDGEITDALFDQLDARVGGPATDRVVAAPEEVDLTVPVKHLKTFGGSEGTLYLSPERIVYRTEADEQSREWRLDRDVASVWSSDPYRLEVHVYQGSGGSFRQPKPYQFSLKQPLDRGTYRRLKSRLYKIERDRTQER